MVEFCYCLVKFFVNFGLLIFYGMGICGGVISFLGVWWVMVWFDFLSIYIYVCDLFYGLEIRFFV